MKEGSTIHIWIKFRFIEPIYKDIYNLIIFTKLLMVSDIDDN